MELIFHYFGCEWKKQTIYVAGMNEQKNLSWKLWQNVVCCDWSECGDCPGLMLDSWPEVLLDNATKRVYSHASSSARLRSEQSPANMLTMKMHVD